MAQSRRHSKHERRNPLVSFAEIFLTGASWVSVLALWCCAASVYVSPADWRIFGVAGLGFPLVLGGTIAMFLLTLLFCPRRAWICLLGILFASGSIRSYVPYNPFLKDTDEPQLALMSYNAHGFTGLIADSDRIEFLNYLLRENIDIFCFQEGVRSVTEWDNIVPAFRERFPYLEMPYTGPGNEELVLGVYAPYPIVRSELVTSHTGNGVIAFWLLRNTGDSLLVVNCHLKSNNLSPEDREQYRNMMPSREGGVQSTLQRQYEHPDSTYLTSRHLAGKIATAAAIRAAMTDTVIHFLSQHPDLPTIVCGDFNEIPISYSTQRLRRHGLTDAFRTAGNGLGFTFNNDAIAVRIDHQYCSDHFKPVKARVADEAQWSDHYPIIVSYQVK